MRSARFLISSLALVSALALVSSCAGKVSPAPPADLFARPARPVMPAEAVDSEAVFEGWRDDVDDWGRTLDWRFYVACKWFEDAGLKVVCGDEPAKIPW